MKEMGVVSADKPKPKEKNIQPKIMLRLGLDFFCTKKLNQPVVANIY